ncbi:MAG: hypothetical protein MZW92_34605 [Comamonadaceae bacterium]|nr:hypothetical protein [Comamonadaceae bacterium]
MRISDGLVVASLRRELRQLVEVAGVGDDGRVLLELVELVHAGAALRPVGRRRWD